MAYETREPQRICPAITAILEYEWINRVSVLQNSDIDYTITLCDYDGNIYEKTEFAYWLLKARKRTVELKEFYEGYQADNAVKAAACWKKRGCPYEQAIVLFCGNENDKRTAIEILQKLGAATVTEKLKLEMRNSGIKSIPRGIRKSTQTNPANLTEREVGVLQLLKDGLHNKEIALKLFISPKTVDHHMTSIFFKLDVNSRAKAVKEAGRLGVIQES